MTAVVDIMGSSCYEMEKMKEINAKVDITDGRLDIWEKAYKICKEYLKGQWESVSRNDFQVTVLEGGLSNKLYICRIPRTIETETTECPNIVVLRIYGLIMQDYTVQMQDSVVFSILSERKIGPHLYAVFPGGRLEEYIPCRTLKACDLSDPVFSRQIARRVADYHKMEMPVTKQPTTIMNKLQFCVDNLCHVQFDDEHNSTLLRAFMEFNIREELDYIKALISDTDSPVVFCHNDVQEGNLLYVGEVRSNTNPIQMIDFEYSCYNYRGFDIGNHFCEWMFDYNHQEWPYFTYKQGNYPTRRQQANFIKSYMEGHFSNVDETNHDPNQGEMALMIKEANRFALLSHLFWASWYVIKAKMCEKDFGYLEYAIVRMEAYFHMKKDVQ